MAFTREDLDIYIKMALMRVSGGDKKAFSHTNWSIQEKAIHTISKHIGED